MFSSTSSWYNLDGLNICTVSRTDLFYNTADILGALERWIHREPLPADAAEKVFELISLILVLVINCIS